VLLVTTRTRALTTVGGVLAAAVALALFGTAPAGMVALATLWFAATGPDTVGAVAVDLRGVHVDPREVRRYREDHPGTTIGEGASAVARH